MLSPRFHTRTIRLFFCTALLLAPAIASAQHSHGVLTPGVTFPPDDSVIDEPPKLITMSFRVQVLLLKLALYTADEEWININFSYDPERRSGSFVLPIPGEIPQSRYYTARWSVIDDNRRIINGEFKFAVGDGAIPPSETIESEYSQAVEVLPSTGSYRYTTVPGNEKKRED